MPENAIAALVCRTAKDLIDSGVVQNASEELVTLATSAADLPELYDGASASVFRVPTEEPPIKLFDRLVTCSVEDVDTYFYCLAELHKRRLRYESILSAQPFLALNK